MASLLAILLLDSASAGAGAKPHILFILQDDLGHYDVGFNGNTESRDTVTGNITKLADDGIVLRSHYTHWHCSPTRRSFLTGRLPVHHHEQLSGVSTDDIDLRWTWVSAKLKSAGYSCFWYGKGHTGYKSMAHLPTSNGFDRFTGFLSGAQSYTASARWEDDHPMETDGQMVNPPARCTLPSIGDAVAAGLARYGVDPAHRDGGRLGPTCGMKDVRPKTTFQCPGAATVVAAGGPDACCAACVAADGGSTVLGNCSHWTWLQSTGKCTMWPGGNCKYTTNVAGAVSGKAFDPRPGPPGPPGPHPGPPPHNDTGCHANSYSTTLYGEYALQALDGHSSTTPFFLYFPIQAVHTPYDKVPFWTEEDTYAGMLWDSDVYIGALVGLLKSKSMYANSVIVYTADNGGTGAGLNYPLRGEKHTNWDGGMRTAAFVSGGLIPASLRGSASVLNCHVVDWYPTFSYLAGVDGTDDPPVPPLPVDPSNPTLDIYGNHSYPGVDGVNIWPMLIDPSNHNKSSAHPYLVLSKEVIIAGNYKLLVGQNFGWDHSSDDGWKLPGPNGSWEGAVWTSPNKPMPCGANDMNVGGIPLMTLPGIPGQLPCLFDLEADTSERNDLGPDPANREMLQHLWDVLNRTVMTRYCRNVKAHSSGSCDRSPPEKLGLCDLACAKKHWGGNIGPICGVPGCNGTQSA